MEKELSESGKSLDIAACLNNIANIKETQGKYEEALSLYEESLKMKKELIESGKSLDIAASLNNIATIKITQGKYEEALS